MPIIIEEKGITMEYEMSIPAILIGVLKKWKLMLVIFLVVFGALMAKNIYSAVQAAEANNKKVDEAAAGYVIEEKTVTTTNQEVLTVSQLNQRINHLKQIIEYYNSISDNSPKMKADINNVYNYCRTYLIRLSNSSEIDSEKFLTSLVSSLQNYILSNSFKNELSSVSDILNLDYLSDVIVLETTGMSLNINVRYLDNASSKRLMNATEPLLIKKLDELKTSTEGFTYSLIDTTEFSFADASLITDKSNNDAALSKAKADYESLKTLAMTVEKEDQIGVIEPVEIEDIQKVSWQSKLSKKSILIAAIVGIFVAVIFAVLWFLLFSRKIHSAYELSDYLHCPILDAESSGTKGMFVRHQYRVFNNRDVSIEYVKLRNTFKNNEAGKVIIENVGFDSDNEYPERVAKEIRNAGMEVISVDDYYSRAEYMEKWNEGDKCVFVVNLQNALKKDLQTKLSDLQSVGVGVFGSFVMLHSE